MFAIVQQNNEIHETGAPQQRESGATVARQSQCGDHRVRHRGGVGDRGQFDDARPPEWAAARRRATSRAKAVLPTPPGPTIVTSGSRVDDLGQRGEVFVTAQQRG